MESTNEIMFYAFYNGIMYDIYANSLYAAKLKTIQQLKIPKSKQGLLSVVNAAGHDNQDFRFA